jgi:hypothetical protein
MEKEIPMKTILLVRRQATFYLCIFLALAAPWAPQAQESDDELLKSLIDSIGDVNSSDGTYDELRISRIDIRIEGTTDERWVRRQLLFHEGQSFSESAWKDLAERQKALFEGTTLFYSVRIFLQPNPDKTFTAVIELVDGFMMRFNFWPWDLFVGFEHLKNGQDFLGLTLGLNTQAVEWDHPFVHGSIFGYSVDLGHSRTYQEPGWLLDSVDAGGTLYLSHGPMLRAGVEAHTKWWTLPESSWLEPDLSPQAIQKNLSSLGISGSGAVLALGLKTELWPDYQFQSPLGIHAEVGGGALVPLDGGSNGWYVDSSLILFAKPLDKLLLHTRIDVNHRDGEISPVLYPSTGEYRSSEWLRPDRLLTRGTLQVTGLRLFKLGLGFTTLYFHPFAYIDAAETVESPATWSVSGIHCATGGGMTFEFGNPVYLFFTFGLKESISPALAPAFWFSVDVSLY